MATPKRIQLTHAELHTILDTWTKDELIRQIIRMYDQSGEVLAKVDDLKEKMVEKGIVPE